MIYLITYNLNKPGKDYTSLYNALRKYNYIRDTALESIWFVNTSWNSAQIYEHLRLHFDINDRLFITQITKGTNYGYMNKEVWDWINLRT